MAKVKIKEPTKAAPPPAKPRRWFPMKLFLAGGLVAVTATSYPAWKHLLPNLAGREEYKVRAEHITITQPPHWIPRHLVEQVLEQANLAGDLSLLDDNLSKNIAEAFELHPWVEKVISVKKSFPAAVDVQLDYRRPVAMVQVKQGMYPVDPQGILLPPEDFAVSDTKLYPVIINVHSTPQGPAGSSWGDPAVIGAAKLADALAAHWKKFKLASIECPRGTAASEQMFVLLSEGGSRIMWGRVPGSDHPGELSLDQKIGRLKYVIDKRGGFDQPNGPYEIDIRHWRDISITPLAQRDNETIRQ